MEQNILLMVFLLLPLLGSFAMFLSGNKSKDFGKVFGLAVSGIVLAIAAYIAVGFYNGDADILKVVDYEWISVNGIDIHFKLGVDGISVLMVLLTAILVFVVELFSFNENDNPNRFHALLLAMELGLMGVYMAKDMFLFYIMWEVTLIPMFFMISWYGGPRRHYSAMKFFIYTHVASLIMLIGIFLLAFYSSVDEVISFDMDIIRENVASIDPAIASAIFGLLLFGFIVKMPIVPFHTWLPDAHVEAPTAGSVLLAGVMLKMGSYGIIRVCIGNFANAQLAFPDIAINWGWVLIILGIISMIYGAYACIAQKDLKKMVAYSSISHMGMVLLGIGCYMVMMYNGVELVTASIGLQFAIFQMFAHGLITAVLFMVCGLAGHNFGTREIPLLGGLAAKYPAWAFFMMFGFMASLGLPGLVGFVAEFGIMYSVWQTVADNWQLWWMIGFGMLSMMLTAGYYLWAMQRTLFGKVTTKIDHNKAHDISKNEFAAMAIMCALIAFFGILPSVGMGLINLDCVLWGVI